MRPPAYRGRARPERTSHAESPRLPHPLGLLAGLPSTASLQQLSADDQKTLYALGRAMSQGLAPFMLSPAELEVVQSGLRDGVLGTGPKVDVQAAQDKIQALQRSRATAVAAAEKKAGQDYLDKAATAPGATKTASGLIITTLAPGAGDSPKVGDRVKAHYQGTLIDGTVFDSSRERGEPATFSRERGDRLLDRGTAAHESRWQEPAGLPRRRSPTAIGACPRESSRARRSCSRWSCWRSSSEPAGVIACWTEGLQLMKVGRKSRLVCPSTLAYGDRGSPPRVSPGATLVFDVHLLDIVK